jgi:hypothetical protein
MWCFFREWAISANWAPAEGQRMTDGEHDGYERDAVRAFKKAGRHLLIAAGLLLVGGIAAYTISPWLMVLILVPTLVFLGLGAVWLVAGAIQLASGWGRSR